MHSKEVKVIKRHTLSGVTSVKCVVSIFANIQI